MATEPATAAAAGAVVLRALKRNPTDWHMPADLSDALSLSREAVFAGIEGLRTKGYSIEFHPYFGFRLVDLPEHYLAEEITADLNTRYVPGEIVVFESVGSTLDAAWELAEQNTRDGGVVLADEQLRGRGRLGKSWHAPRGGGMYVALVLRPGATTPPDERLSAYVAAGALSIAHMVTDICHLPAQIRWPNDVVVGGRKIGHVMLETREEHPGTIVLGLNLNTRLRVQGLTDELRGNATSIAIEGGGEVNHNRLLRYLLFYVDSLYQKLRRGRLRPIELGIREYSALTDHEVIVETATGEHRGKVRDQSAHTLTLTPSKGQDEDGAEGSPIVIPDTAVRRLRVLQ